MRDDDYVYVVVSVGGLRHSQELKTIDEAIAYLNGAKPVDQNTVKLESELSQFPSEGDGY